MIVGNKRYCDECNSDNAQRYIREWVVHDYCLDCAIKFNLPIYENNRRKGKSTKGV